MEAARSLRQLANYVVHNCKDDMTTFLKSGFPPVTIRTPVKPLSESIRNIVPGDNSGQNGSARRSSHLPCRLIPLNGQGRAEEPIE